MRSVSVRLDDLRNMILNIGFVGENEHKRFIFDCKKMFDQYPHAAASMTVQPPEGEAYPAIIERDGDYVIWDVTDSDLAHDGDGELQLAFTQEPHIAKSYIGRTRVCPALVPSGDIPDPLDDFLTRAGAALTAIQETIDTALEEAKESGEFDGPQGPEGPAGADGAPGADGFSPTATVTKHGKVATITITDKNGTTTATVSDGESGSGGSGDYSDLTNKPQIGGVTLSGNKSLSDLGIAAESDIPDVSGFYTKPASGIPASDLASGVIPDVSGFYTKPSSGIPASDLASGVIPDVSGFYTKPSGGIPGTDLADSYIEEPASDGTNGQVLTTDGSGNRSWTTPYSGTIVETVSGTTPSITGAADHRYICGECSTLSITAPASGCIDVVFESGSTATVLTVTSAKSGVTAIKWAGGFDPTSLDANTTYEINILDGEYGVVGSWT